MLKLILTTGLLLAVTPAYAQVPPQTSASSQSTPAQPPKKERVICRTEEQIGSRLAGKETCMTASQWKQYELDTQRQLDDLHTQVQPTGGPG